MALKTLEELNQDFISVTAELNAADAHADAEREVEGIISGMRRGSEAAPDSAREKKWMPEPIKPLVIEVELPAAKARETMSQKDSGEARSKRGRGKKRSMFTAISDMLFSLAIFMILVVVLTPGSGNGAPKTLFGYSYFTVLSPSMQDEIPKGSFILVKHEEPQSLEVGDNITFRVNKDTSWTHKIVGIYENYENSGARGFQTKGVNNAEPDLSVVYESSVVGKVIFVLPVVGAALIYLGENVFLVFIIFGLFMLLSFLLRGVFRKSAAKVEKEERYISNKRQKEAQ